MEITEFRGQYRWLSNFVPAPVTFEGMLFPTVEHAYQAAKTLDWDEREKVRICRSAGDAKRMGKRLKLREDWEAVKLPIMRRLLVQKFNAPGFKEALLATGGAQLIEGNYWGDTFWGVCRGVGLNHLGKLIMDVRMELHPGGR